MAPRQTTYVALLRGINVGSHNKISMAALRELVEAAGGKDVETYVQSGNVVLRSARSASELGPELECRIERELGLTVAVVVRTKAELARVAAGNPFAADEPDPKKLHVAFLAEKPARARVRDVEAADLGPERVHVAGKDVYLHYPNGYGRSKLSNAFLERRLGVASTTRNWRTVTKLAELCAG